MTGRPLARRLALAATVLAAAWAGVLVFAGGFDVRVGDWTVSSHQAVRPILLGSVTLAVFVWANGVGRTAEAWSHAMAGLNHTVVAAALAAGAFAVGTAYSTTVANASDPYGYVSQADLWLNGSLRIAQPWVRDAPWPRASWTFAPLGYRPAGGNDESTDLVPVYSPGLPLLMAAAKGIRGQCGLFLVVPISGALLVLATWGIGTRLGSSGAGLVAAWFVFASPAFLYMLALPMTDVPVAACWATVWYLVLGGGGRNAVGAGLAVGLAILIRPNLLWLAAIPAAWLWWPRASTLIGYVAGVLAAGATIALVNDQLHGSPWRSGYGDLGVFFAWSHFLPNLRNYTVWLLETQTPLVVAGAAAFVLPLRRVWPHTRDRRIFWLAGLFVAALWVFYSVYLPFNDWWFLRFLLPAWPLLMIGLAAVLLAVARATGPGGVVAVTWLVVVLGVYTFDVARARGAFALWQADREYVAAARATWSLTPERSVVFADLHSGSLRYYGGRTTLRFPLLDAAWLDRALAWLSERGIASYALLERGEVAAFRSQFADQAATTRLDERPIVRSEASGLSLYALAAPPVTATLPLAVAAEGLRCAGPVALPPLLTR